MDGGGDDDEDDEMKVETIKEEADDNGLINPNEVDL